MSIYSVCCSSSSYGLVSGNDRQSLIRYWDRRQCKILMVALLITNRLLLIFCVSKELQSFSVQ